MGDRGLNMMLERKRLKIKQKDLMGPLDIGEAAIIAYEKPENDDKRREPDAKQLLAMAKLGLDVDFILFGERRVDVTESPDQLRELVQVAKDSKDIEGALNALKAWAATRA